MPLRGAIRGKPEVVYHKPTLEHIEMYPLATSREMLVRLDARGGTVGVRLPQALREWYALADACEMLWALIFVDSGGDSVYLPELLGEPERIHPFSAMPRYLNHLEAGHLPFMEEHQGDAEWALVLDGSDDPPVVVAQQPFGGPDPADPSEWAYPATAAEVAWKPHARTFSSFVFSRCWYYRFADVRIIDSPWFAASGGDANWGPRFTTNCPYTLTAYQDDPLGAVDLAFLRANFREGPVTTNWPPETISYQFGQDQDGFLLIQTSATGAPCFVRFDPYEFTKNLSERVRNAGCLWTIWGSSPACLERLAQRILHCGQFSERVFGMGDNKELGRRLRQVRRR